MSIKFSVSLSEKNVDQSLVLANSINELLKRHGGQVVFLSILKIKSATGPGYKFTYTEQHHPNQRIELERFLARRLNTTVESVRSIIGDGGVITADTLDRLVNGGREEGIRMMIGEFREY